MAAMTNAAEIVGISIAAENTVVIAVVPRVAANTAVAGKKDNISEAGRIISPLPAIVAFCYSGLSGDSKSVYVKISESVYQNAVVQLEYKTHELFGIIGSSGQNLIDSFLRDENAVSSEYHCMPCSAINQVLQKGNGVCFVGILHSHPPGRHKLSDADIQYAHSIIHASKNLPFILMGIVSDQNIYLYQVSQEKSIYLDLKIIKC